MDQTGRVTFINPAALTLTGFEAEEVMGQNLHGLMHHKKADGTPYPEEECPIYATLKYGEKQSGNRRCLLDQGRRASLGGVCDYPH